MITRRIHWFRLLQETLAIHTRTDITREEALETVSPRVVELSEVIEINNWTDMSGYPKSMQQLQELVDCYLLDL